MKTKLLLLGVAMSAIFITSSCQKDELVYSCDPRTNSWVKSNLSHIAKMSSKDWSEVDDISKQRAIYAAFTPSQKAELWQRKVSATLELDWSSNERQHLEKLRNIINNNLYVFNESTRESDEFEIESYRWMTFALDSLAWSRQLIGSILQMPHLIIDKSGTLALPQTTFPLVRGGGEGNAERDCDCSSSDSDASFICYERCQGYYFCNESSTGCGTFWGKRCDGLCVD